MLLAGRFANEHPVLNTVLMAGVLLLITGLVVFAKPVGRLLDRINMTALQALGIADKDRRGRERDPGDNTDTDG